jgi:hypothetical protein
MIACSMRKICKRRISKDGLLEPIIINLRDSDSEESKSSDEDD